MTQLYYSEEDWLLISGIQHFVFCKRQWALIHIEQAWKDNVLTYEGTQLHTNADDVTFKEKRKDLLVVRGLRIHSAELGISGICDVVEFNKSQDGVQLNGRKSRYQPLVVEYKHGHQKRDLSDTLQLVLETMCLEEMLGANIDKGDLFYFKTRQRETVLVSEELRESAKTVLAEMHQYWQKRYTPKVRITAKCKSCSLADICLPVLNKKRSAARYIEERLID
ncbi:exonuclease RecB family protein [Lacticaseibacillus zeae DSM 20178 = KCTC 3804]|uniref:CRISPR-associated exonuclease Cas4 n=1 Tax=Lacticaseibacillus zeae DSM 20178 = KCTC 3804 TaxID=1423816 RepID=A0A0R1EUA7_LACZE|nr:exonuclease RecB family protein [Lacticaseibacillus zeae DSM 20178 = KCTC 3804]